MTIQSPVQPPLPPPNQPPVNLLPTNPLGVGDLIDRSFRLYRRNFKVFLYMAAVLLLPWTIISGFFTQSMMQNQLAALQQLFTDNLANPNAFDQFAAMNQSAEYAGFLFLLSLVGGVLYLVTFVGLIFLAVRTLHGDTPTLGLGFAGARANFWAAIRLVILYFLLGLAMVLVMFVIFFVFSLLGAGLFGGLLGASGGFLSQSDSEMGAVIAFLVALCCVIPIAFAILFGPPIYFLSRWSVTMPALVHSGFGARQSLRESWELTRGKVWRVIGYFVLVYLLTFVIFALPFYMIQGASMLLLGFENLWLSALIGTVASAILTTLWLPMTAILPTMLYFDLRTRKNMGGSTSLAQRPSTVVSVAGAPVVSTPPYAGPTWAPEAPPSSPTETSVGADASTSPRQTPYSWSQSEEPDDPWESPPKPPSSDNS